MVERGYTKSFDEFLKEYTLTTSKDKEFKEFLNN